MALLTSIEQRQANRKNLRKAIKEKAAKLPDPTDKKEVDTWTKKLKDMHQVGFLKACDLIEYDVDLMLFLLKKYQPNMQKLNSDLHEVAEQKRDVLCDLEYLDNEDVDPEQPSLFDAYEEKNNDNSNADEGTAASAGDSGGAKKGSQGNNGSKGSDVSAKADTGKGSGRGRKTTTRSTGKGAKEKKPGSGDTGGYSERPTGEAVSAAK